MGAGSQYSFFSKAEYPPPPDRTSSCRRVDRGFLMNVEAFLFGCRIAFFFYCMFLRVWLSAHSPLEAIQWSVGDASVRETEIGRNTVSKHQIQPEYGDWAG